MKLLYAVLLILFACPVFSTPLIKAKSNGRWSQPTSWDLNRVPQNGDTVFIPANIDITLDFNESLNNIFLKITGALKLNNGKLNLNASSKIIIGVEGRLTGNGNNDQVKIGGDFKFRGGVDQTILGPAFADSSTGTSPNGFQGGLSLLSATLTNFAVNKVNEQVYIGWESVPGNTTRFEIEKSLNGNSWSLLETIPVTGDPNRSQQYLFIDRTRGTAYYRVKQVFAASISYTAVRAVNITGKGAITISSAPAQMIRVRSDASLSFPVKITVTDMSGGVVQQVNYETPVLFMDFRIRTLNNGRFVVHVLDAGGVEKSGIVVL